MQRDYAEARQRYHEALALFQTMSEPASEATIWHQLGMVAEEQRQWAEAERCYRESLAIKERQGNAAGAAMTCNQLAIVATGAGHPDEAERWYTRAIEIDERLGNDKEIAGDLNNLANLIQDEVRAGRAPATRLAEARQHAERALAIVKNIGCLFGELWKTLSILAEIADLEGRTEAARGYRRRERETFAAFAGNRWHIDNQHGQLIAAIAAAAQGNAQARAAVEEVLPGLEANGWEDAPMPRAGIWAGEREWHALVEEIGSAARRCWCCGCWRRWRRRQRPALPWMTRAARRNGRQ